MKHFISQESAGAEERLPPRQSDGSGIGVNYADAYLKVLNVQLADGRKVTCKRKGLKITLELGDRKGEALLRRLEYGPDLRRLLRRALEAAAAGAGARLSVEDGAIYLEE